MVWIQWLLKGKGDPESACNGFHTLVKFTPRVTVSRVEAPGLVAETCGGLPVVDSAGVVAVLDALPVRGVRHAVGACRMAHDDLSGWLTPTLPLNVMSWTLLLLLLAGFVWLIAARIVAARATNATTLLEATRLVAVVESASDALISVDNEFRIVLFNAAAERMFGCPKHQAIGMPIETFIPLELRGLHAAHVGAFVANGQDRVRMAAGREVRGLRLDGSEVAVEATVSKAVVPGSGGQRQLYTVVLRDVSRRKATEAQLHRVSERYRQVVEQSPDAIWLAERGRVVLANPAFAALLGARSGDEVIGRELREFIPLWPPGLGTDLDARGVPLPRVLQVRRLDGGVCDVELSVADVPDHGGRAVQGVMRDITARRQAEELLHETQRSLIEAQRIARLGYFGFDIASRRWTLSPSLLELLGDPDGRRERGDEVMDLVHGDDRSAVQARLAPEALNAGLPIDFEFRVVRAGDARVRWLHALGRTRVDTSGRATQLFGSVQDFTERKLAMQALEDSREELRRLSASLTRAREEERRHVARELHDELGQRLSALKLDLSALLAAEPPTMAAGTDRLRRLVAEVGEAMAATRRIAADLRPAMLDDLGLSAAIEWLASDWRDRARLDIELDCEPLDDLLSEAAVTTVYRIVQEALTNVMRHARATRARIVVRRSDGDLRVAIEDNGAGLALGDAGKRGSNGLTGIRERAHILGGSASIVNRVEGGCRLEVRLPLDRVDRRRATLQETL